MTLLGTSREPGGHFWIQDGQTALLNEHMRCTLNLQIPMGAPQSDSSWDIQGALGGISKLGWTDDLI